MEGSTATRRGTISGTLLHMAPERLQDQPPGAASDIYSLGSSLFTAVTGVAPVGHAGEAAGVVIARTLRGGPYFPTTDGPELPLSFRSIVEQALAVDPEDRQATAAEVGEQLRAVQIGAGIHPTAMLVRDGRGIGPPPGGWPPDAGDTSPPIPTPAVTDVSPPSPDAHGRRKLRAVTVGGLTATVIAIMVAAAVAGMGPFRPSAPTSETGGAPTTMPVTPSTTGDLTGGPVLTVGDEFSDRSSGWTDGNDAFYDNDGTYRIRLTRDHTLRAMGPREADPAVAALAEDGVSVSVDVDAEVVSDTLIGRGLFCRRSAGDDGHYQGVLFPNGRWVITRNRTGSSTPLAEGQTTLPVGGMQRIGFDCRDDGDATILRFRLGTDTLGEATDPGGLKGGHMGVVAATANAPGGEVAFDNFVVAKG